jgi:RNA polymerase sigma-70 factor (ECF subfamily)
MDIARLFTGVQKNDRREFDALVHRCHRQAYNIAYRLTGNHADAEDLTQESFLRAYRFFDRYNRDMPFENWLYRIMSRVFIDEIRKRPKFKTQSLDAPLSFNDGNDADILLEIPDSVFDPEQMMLSEALEENLQNALNTLPDEFRIAVILGTSKVFPTKRLQILCVALWEPCGLVCIADESCFARDWRWQREIRRRDP